MQRLREIILIKIGLKLSYFSKHCKSCGILVKICKSCSPHTLLLLPAVKYGTMVRHGSRSEVRSTQNLNVPYCHPCLSQLVSEALAGKINFDSPPFFAICQDTPFENKVYEAKT